MIRVLLGALFGGGGLGFGLARFLYRRADPVQIATKLLNKSTAAYRRGNNTAGTVFADAADRILKQVTPPKDTP